MARVKCPRCQTVVQVEASAGDVTACTACGAKLRLPAAQAPGEAAEKRGQPASSATAQESITPAPATSVPALPPAAYLDELEIVDEERPRRRSIRRDDEVDDDDRQPAPGFPVTAILAGLIWIGFGLLLAVGSFSNMLLRGAGVSLAAMIGIGLLGLAYLMAGVQAIRGRLRGLLAAALGSLLFSLLYCVIGVVTLGGVQRLPADNRGIAGLVALALILLSGGLLFAGLLGLVGHGKYQRWRAATGLSKPPPARRRRRDDDYDD